MNLEQLLETLASPIIVRPTRRMTQGELESYLDKAADILRGNADHSLHGRMRDAWRLVPVWAQRGNGTLL